MDISLIEPTKKTLRQLFIGDSCHISIPKYQRPFSWDENNADRFYSDIFNQKESYFLGSILLNQREGIYEVIDGQQRITTCSLFLLALYLYYKQNCSPESASDIRLFLKRGNFSSKTNTLILNRINNEFYSSLLEIKSIEEISHLKTDNESNLSILKILKFFVAKLSQEKNNDENLETKRIEKIVEHFSEKVFFIVIISKDLKQASKLFEVLNNRGAELSEADLVRNYLLLKSDEQNFNDGLVMWESLEDKIGIDNLEQFLRYSSFLVSSEGSIYERIFQYTELNSSKTVIEFLLNLVDDYLQIIDPSSFNENPESTYLENINILGVSQVRSVLLAASKKFEKNDYTFLIKNLENFIFRYSIICGKNPNRIEQFSREISIKIYKNDIKLNDILKEIRVLDPVEDEFETSFRIRKFKNTKIPRYILEKIEDSISVGDKGVIRDSVHLEHIMPKKIDRWTKEDVYFSKDFHDEFLNNIGNMVLLHEKINTAIKNDVFSNKKNSYEGDINLITEIKNRSSWKKEDIEWNLSRYLGWAKNVWPKL